MSDQSQFCLDLLRENDPPLYASLLFVNKEQREAAAVLQAFHFEIGRISFLVQEAMPGEIRLQWWRDVINGERDGEANANPLANALLAMIARYKLSSDGFVRYLDARVFDLYNDPMPDRDTLDAYFGETESFIYHMTALVCGVEENTSLADACGHAGVATGLERMLARFPYDRSRQRCFIPMRELEKNELNAALWYYGNTAAHNEIIKAQLVFANEHLNKARRAIKCLPKKAQAAFLPLVISSEKIRKLETQDVALVLEGKDQRPSSMKLQWALWKAAMFGV